MVELSRTQSKRTPNSQDFKDLEKAIFQENDDTYSQNMNRLFAADEKNSAPVEEKSLTSKEASTLYERSKQSPSSRTSTYFTATAFWKNLTESVKVGIVLSKSDKDNLLYFIMYDTNKKVLKTFRIDDLDFQFLEEKLAVCLKFELREPTEGQPSSSVQVDDFVKVKFVDRSTFLRFAVTALVQSSKQICFKIFEGSGDREIDYSCEIRYDRIEHCTDGEGGLKLPNHRTGLKTRMTKEKLGDHAVYKWLGGCKKGCHFLIKATEYSVYEVIVDKVRKTVDTVDCDYVSQPELRQVFDEIHCQPPNYRAEVGQKHDAKNEESSNDILLVSHSNATSIDQDHITPTPSPAPPLVQVSPPSSIQSDFPPQQQPSVSEDVRDALHRIVGIELDRIEMRLNDKFEKLQNNLIARLDRQTDILQQLLDKSTSN